MRHLLTFLVLVVTLGWAADDLNAQRRGGGRMARGGARASVHARPSPRHTARVDVNRRANIDVGNRYVNRNVDIRRPVNTRDVDIDIHDHRWDGCCHRHPVARAAVATAAVATAAAAVGSVVYSLPPACTAVIVDGVTYEQCDGMWYRPAFDGMTTTYIVVEAPR